MTSRMLTGNRSTRCGRLRDRPVGSRASRAKHAACRLAAMLVATAAPFGTTTVWAAPDEPSAQLAAMTVGSGDVAQAPRPAWTAQDTTALLAPRPSVTLTATRAEPAYRFRGLPSNDVQGLSYRWWLGSGRGAVGFGLGTIGYAVPVANEGGAATGITATTVVGSVPTASIGLRYALTPTTQAYADGSGARGLAGEDEIFYNAKAGVEWKTAKSRLGFEGGRLGLQLDSGYRMSLRTRKGGVTFYLRRQF